MKKNLLLILFIITSGTLSAQTEESYNYNQYPIEKLQWGDYYYHSSYKGLSSLMADLRTLDPELFTSLEPRFKELQKRRQNAGIILGAGAVIGTGMMVGGILTATPNNEDFYYGKNRQSKGIVLMAGGAAVALAASLIYRNKKVKQSDIFDFTNQFNQHTKGEKLRISMQPTLRLDKEVTAGFSLCLGF